MDKDTVRELVNLDTKSIGNKQIAINEKHFCRFWRPELKDGETYMFFSEWYADKNCPRSSCYADVFVGDDKGRIYIHNDHDLGESSAYTIELMMFNGNKAVSGIIATSCRLLEC